MSIFRIFVALTLCFGAFCFAAAADSTKSYSRYIPEVHATMRMQYEISTEDGYGHFNVRNARVNMKGSLTDFLGYFLRADFSDRGKFVMRDAYAIVQPAASLRIMLGQMRVPLSVSATRSVHEYWFAHSSLVNHGMWSSRKVGIKARYSFRLVEAPAFVEGGVFSSSSTTDHKPWSKDYTFGAVGAATFGQWTPEVGFQSNMLGSVRCNLWDASLTWADGTLWEAEIEGLWKGYSHNSAPATKAFNIKGRRFFPLRSRFADRVSLDLRYDGATDLYGASADDPAILELTQTKRQRITVGSTLAYLKGPVQAHLRLNYEQFFHSSHHSYDTSDSNRLCLELMLHF